MKQLYLSLLLFACSFRAMAQVQAKFSTTSLLSERGIFDSPKSAPTIDIPKVDISRFLQEDSIQAPLGVPFRFGYDTDVDYTPENLGVWLEKADGRIWKLNIRSQGAYSINLIFDELILPDSSQLYIYNGDRTMLYGPITSQNINEGVGFGTDLIQGDLITLELFEPKEAKARSKLRIAKVIHGYKDVFNTPNNFGDALGCHNNVSCNDFSDWHNQSNSVAMVLLANNTRMCSGALLNNICGDMVPNFLTAFHCIDVGDNNNPCEAEAGNGVLSATEINRAQNWVFRFQYKSPTCTPSSEPTTWMTFNGSTFRAGWFNADFALVEMNNRPSASTGIQYAGWSRNTTAPSSGASIHHPSGDVMKISTYNNPATNSSEIIWGYGCPPLTNTTPISTHWTLTLNSGTSEGGSSGGPLFDQNGRVVGQLHGGGNSCAPVMMHYGKLDLSWNGGGTAQTRLRDWLDPN